MLRRYEDWPSRLATAIEARREAPFSWGSHDCCSAAWGLVEAMTGVDLGRSCRGHPGYRSARGARERLDLYGGGVERVAIASAAEHGITAVDPARAGRGDVVLVRHGGEDHLGVIDSSGRMALVVSKIGWSSVPISIVCRAWRIG